MGAMTHRTGGEWVVAALEAEGVRHVFGIPGVHNLAIYDALLRQDRIAHVLARHEQGAGFMADGYARASGRPGVVVVTTGPGATNALTPLVEAQAGSQPVLLVMSDIPVALIGQDVGALHEVPNQIECFRPVCRWADALRGGAEIPGAIQGAFHLFRTGRPGPVALSIPTDVLNAPVAARLTPAGAGRRPPCDVGLIEEAARYLARAERPLLVAGGGASRRTRRASSRRSHVGSAHRSSRPSWGEARSPRRIRSGRASCPTGGPRRTRWRRPT